MRVFRNLAESDAAAADDIGAHRNPLDADAGLSALSRANLRAWLADDYRIYAWCENWRRRVLRAHDLS